MQPRRRLICAAALSVMALAAHAQRFPDKPIRLIVPYTTGGGTDLMARIIGTKMSANLGVSVVVENKPGAGAVIGTDLVAKSAPDGHTIGLISSGHAINPKLYSKLPFDPVKGFEPVLQVATGPNVLVVNAQLPVRTVAELIALLRKEPGRLSYGSAGLGNPTHLAGELFQKATSTTLIHVPYKGSGQAEIGLAGGEITMMIDSIPAALPFITSGKTRALAVTGTRRFPTLPDVPTMTEAGLDYEMITWWGVVAPAGTPKATVDLLNATIAGIVQAPDVREQFLRFGAEPATGSAEQFDKHIRSEIDRYSALIQSLALRPL